MAEADAQGVPPRAIPWAVSQVQVNWRKGTVGGQAVIVVTIDTGSSRTVTYWKPEELRGLAETLFTAATGGLTVADAGDLSKLGLTEA